MQLNVALWCLGSSTRIFLMVVYSARVLSINEGRVEENVVNWEEVARLYANRA